MICIVKLDGEQIAGWIIATDTHDARRQAMGMLSDFGQSLANTLYTRFENPSPGKHDLGDGLWMLVS